MPEQQGKRRRLAPGERRAQLVAVARELFLQQGIDATSVSDIVAAAGVAQGTFYWYFPSKEDVVRAVAEEYAESFVARARALAAQPGVPAAERLRQLTLGYLASLPGEGPLLRDFHQLEHAELHDRLAHALAAALLDPLTEIIAQGQTAGEFGEMDPCSAAAMVLGVWAGVDLPGRCGEVADSTALAESALAFCLRGLGDSCRGLGDQG